MTTKQKIFSRRWQSTRCEDIQWLKLGQDYVAYHRPSGKTHFLNDASEKLISSILLVPKDVQTVAREFVTEKSSIDDEILDEMTSMLVRLEELGLIEPT